MTTKQRFRNKYRLQLREKDHEPMHVHLVGGEVNARFDLLTLEKVAGHVPREVPPRQNSCRPDMILNLGAIRMKHGTVRRSIQEQSGGTVVAAGERQYG
ncbi:MAG: DUF4160 domain-containing protein, partial [Sulfuricellaceae bacterium]|nr:DUF4160 domain-containing protein [Sulfuricellaceae bacterium]